MIKRHNSVAKKIVKVPPPPEPKSSRKEKISVLSQEFTALFPQLMESITAEKQIEEKIDENVSRIQTMLDELRAYQKRLEEETRVVKSELQTSITQAREAVPSIAKQIAKEVYEAQPKIPPQEIHHNPIIQKIENTLPVHTERVIERVVESKRTHESRSLTFHYDKDRIVKAVGQDETYTVKYNQFGVPSEIMVQPKE